MARGECLEKTGVVYGATAAGDVEVDFFAFKQLEFSILQFASSTLNIASFPIEYLANGIVLWKGFILDGIYIEWSSILCACRPMVLLLHPAGLGASE